LFDAGGEIAGNDGGSRHYGSGLVGYPAAEGSGQNDILRAEGSTDTERQCD
jgi:hypothetical protein